MIFLFSLIFFNCGIRTKEYNIPFYLSIDQIWTIPIKSGRLSNKSFCLFFHALFSRITAVLFIRTKFSLQKKYASLVKQQKRTFLTTKNSVETTLFLCGNDFSQAKESLSTLCFCCSSSLNRFCRRFIQCPKAGTKNRSAHIHAIGEAKHTAA